MNEQSKVTEKWWQRPQPAWVSMLLGTVLTLSILGAWNLTQSVFAGDAKATPAETELRLAERASAAAPSANSNTVNYEGYLSDSNGNPITGTHNIQFEIFDALSGGSSVWGPELYTNLTVDQGVFSVGLGSLTSGGIPAAVWSGGDRFLEITVDGETLTPRDPIRSTPLAGVADIAQNVPYPNLSSHTIDFVNDIVTYTSANWGTATLDLNTCAVDTICCDSSGNNRICYRSFSSGADAYLELSIVDAHSLACILTHNEDDHPYDNVGLQYATDSGNNAHSEVASIRIRREGNASYPLSHDTGYIAICGW